MHLIYCESGINNSDGTSEMLTLIFGLIWSLPTAGPRPLPRWPRPRTRRRARWGWSARRGWGCPVEEEDGDITFDIPKKYGINDILY